MPPVTMKDIAQAVGVSVMTVSKVMRDRTDVGAETRVRVPAESYGAGAGDRAEPPGRSHRSNFAPSFFC
jgi:transcriptional regulator with XRE-family HTH domain